MAIFNSLGSNYRSDVSSQKRTRLSDSASSDLKTFLEHRYNTESVSLTYKGRQAIYLSLKALHLPDGSKVAINGYTCYAVFDAINRAGLVPHYIDIPKSGLNFSASELEKALRNDDSISAVMIQNTMGFPSDIEKIGEICHKHGLPLIEDLAHSIGLHYNESQEAGTVGVAAALSFSQDKVIDGVSGGALIWRGSGIPQLEMTKPSSFRVFRDWYYPKVTRFIRASYSSGIGKIKLSAMKSLHLLSRPMDGPGKYTDVMSEFSSDLTMRHFERIDKILGHRKQIANIYREILPKKILFDHNDNATYIRFPIRVENRTGLIEHLKSKSVFVGDIWYDAPVSPARSMELTNYKNQCPNAEQLSKEMLNLPTHLNVSPDDAAFIANEVKAWLK